MGNKNINFSLLRKIESGATLVALLTLAVFYAASCSGSEATKNIRKAIEISHRMPVTTDSHPRDMVQGVYAFGPRFTIKEAVTQEKVQALSYLGGSAVMGIVHKDDYGPYFVENVGDRLVEQHRNQFISIIAASGAAEDRSFISIEGKYFTLNDFLRRAITVIDSSEMSAADELVTGPDGNELGWTLILLATANMTTTDWRNYNDKLESTEKILEVALERPMHWGSYSGLIEQLGIAVALRAFKHNKLEEDWAEYRASLKKEESLKLPEPTMDSVELTGVWKLAEEHVATVLETLRRNQSLDASFSHNWYLESEGNVEIDAGDRILYTGMALDFLAVALPDSRLTDPWVSYSVKRLTSVIEHNRFQLYNNVVPLSHAVHALSAYRQRLADRGKQFVPAPEFDDSLQPDSCCGNEASPLPGQ